MPVMPVIWYVGRAISPLEGLKERCIQIVGRARDYSVGALFMVPVWIWAACVSSGMSLL